MVERFKSEERTARRLTGNGYRFSLPGFTRGNYGENYQANPDPGGPSAIAVVTPPSKTSYHDGEEIDFTGLVVQLLDSIGEVYTDVWHPDGTVPITELSFPIKKASYSYIGEGSAGGLDYSTTVPVGWPDTPDTRWTDSVTPDNWVLCAWYVDGRPGYQFLKYWHYYALVDSTDYVVVTTSSDGNNNISYSVQTDLSNTDQIQILKENMFSLQTFRLRQKKKTAHTRFR